MEVVYQCCCGVDVHKASVVACLIRPGADGRLSREVRTFGTMTADLLELMDWLVSADCAAVAMESTGSFWKPLYNLLEGVLPTVLVVNAAHVKATTTDYPHWKHGRLDSRCRGDRSDSCLIRLALSAAGDCEQASSRPYLCC